MIDGDTERFGATSTHLTQPVSFLLMVVVLSTSGKRSEVFLCSMITICALFVIAALLSMSAGDAITSSRHLAVPNAEDYFNEVEEWLNIRRTQLENSVFVSYDKDGNPYPSLWYKFDDFVRTLRPMSVSGVGGGELNKC